MVTATRVTVTSTPILLASRPGHVSLVYDVINNSGTTYIGDSSVTVTTGYHLYASLADHQFHLKSGDSLYGVSTAAVSDVIDVLIIT